MPDAFVDNPYAPPMAALGPPIGQERFYGFANQRMKFSTIYQMSRHPMVWLYWVLQPILTRPQERFSMGIVYPRTVADLQINDFEPHLKSRLAIQHAALQQAGFRFAGYFNGPTFGLAKNVGEVWYDECTICLNLIIQNVSMRRGKQVTAIQALLTTNMDQTSTQTVNSGVSFYDDPSIDSLLMPGTPLSDLIQRHRERLRPKTEVKTLNHDNVWPQVWQYAHAEIEALLKNGLLSPITPAQLQRLIELSQFVDFREQGIPKVLRLLFSLKLPCYLLFVAIVMVSFGYSSFLWAIYLAPVWLLLNNLISFPLFRYLLQSEFLEPAPSQDYFHYLRAEKLIPF